MGNFTRIAQFFKRIGWLAFCCMLSAPLAM